VDYYRLILGSFFAFVESRRQSNTSDCIVLSSSDESDIEDNDLFDPNDIHAFESIIESNGDDGNYWEDIARITHSLMSDNNGENRTRKRRNSSDSSLVSNDDQQRKRIKQSRTDNIEIVTLSSSDSSDNDDQLS